MEFIVFVITAIVALVGAIAMILSKNAVHSALFLLLNFVAIAIFYLLLQSPFLFAVQLTLYAGAIIVLFLFVVMLLGAERDEDSKDRIAWQRPLALVLGLVLLGEALYIFFNQFATNPPPVVEGVVLSDPTLIGESLFTTYLLPFEITAIILLAAIVGVVVLNKREDGSDVEAQQPVEHVEQQPVTPVEVETAKVEG
ncbi:MAG: NADH-quinone oxidoreductase subunit J [Chloroflexota bacterium]